VLLKAACLHNLGGEERVLMVVIAQQRDAGRARFRGVTPRGQREHVANVRRLQQQAKHEG
jgi:hypothetical protein